MKMYNVFICINIYEEVSYHFLTSNTHKQFSIQSATCTLHLCKQISYQVSIKRLMLELNTSINKILFSKTKIVFKNNDSQLF